MPFIVKPTYKKSENKRKVQQLIYSNISNRYNNLIALGGPDLPVYLKLVKKTGIKEALIYEFQVDQLIAQVSKKNQVMPTVVKYGDIIEADNSLSKTLYDLDFCCSIMSVIHHVSKFKSCPTIYTFALRPFSLNKSINIFVKHAYGNLSYDLVLINEKPGYKEYILLLSIGKALSVYTYLDTTPMLVITNNL